ncbi:MAG: hypothetical protein PHF86_01855 [Candidatus Nanoarchaeia archaeon]|nr:hypothetical protein [Candidatus Nanoarchaeia archaeon]
MRNSNTKELVRTKNILPLITKEVKIIMEKIHFCSDLHQGHNKIISICNRPTTILDHDTWLIENFNKYVDKKDSVYILGDLSFEKKEKAEKFIDKLHGQKTLILGNHDKNIHNSTRFAQITQIKDFTFSQFGLNIHIVLCHYPIASWNRKVHGSWHLYGHVHGRFKLPGLAFDVGIDNNEIHQLTENIWRPINLYEICQIMAKKDELETIE